MDTKRRLRKVKVKGLFDWLNHEISFISEDRITIIHGRNGVGKTTVLNLILHMLSGEWNRLFKIDFKEVELEFSDNTIFCATKSREEKKLILKLEGFRPSLSVEIIDIPYRNYKRRRELIHVIDRHLDHVMMIDEDNWHDHYQDDILSLSELIDRYSDALPPRLLRDARENMMLDKVGDVYEFVRSFDTLLIQTHRLVIPGSGRHRVNSRQISTDRYTAVEKNAKNLSTKIEQSLKSAASLSSSLDRTFPVRLLNENVPKQVTEESIKNKYEEQTKYRKRLIEAGFLDSEELVDLPEEKLGEAEVRVLWHYLSGVEEKLQIHTELLEKIELFKKIIIEKSFLRKEMKISKDKGYYFINSFSEEEMPLGSLSSGEQHELVLTYKLLFETNRNTLVLIDEPELSLHVLWQHKFLEDMRRISENAELDFLIATHSPSIARSDKHLLVQLSPFGSEEKNKVGGEEE